MHSPPIDPSPIHPSPGTPSPANSGPRPPSIELGPVRLVVGDLARSIRWYQAVLGLEPAPLSPRGAHHVERGDFAKGMALQAPEGTSPLLELLEEPGAHAAPRGGRPGLFHVALLVPDRPALGRVLAHLMELGISPGAADHGVSDALYLADADGLGLEIYADRPTGAWPRAADGTLRMWTRPMDGGAILAEGQAAEGGLAWTGAPAGTRVGHLHLHTPNLEESEAFYRAWLGFGPSVGAETAREIPGARFVALGGYHHHLGLNLWARHPEPATTGEARLLEWEAALSGAGPIGEAVDPSGVRVLRVAGGAAPGSTT
jgi:catechol 2,3-dioxygenase